MTGDLPAGVGQINLTMHADERGTFTEVYRNEWDTGIEPAQWNVVRSKAGTLRGVHVHPVHHDYLVVVEGSATIGLRDLRRGSPTESRATTIEVSGESLTALSIPPGVAHGFLFHVASMHVYSVSHYWNLADELGCHWADPELEIDWPFAPSLLSENDAAAQPLSSLLDELEPYQPIAGVGR